MKAIAEFLNDFFSDAVAVGATVTVVGLILVAVFLIVGEKRGWWE